MKKQLFLLLCAALVFTNTKPMMQRVAGTAHACLRTVQTASKLLHYFTASMCPKSCEEEKLLVATRLADLEIMKLVLKRRPNVNAIEDVSDSTALSCATHLDAIKLLLDHGVSQETLNHALVKEADKIGPAIITEKIALLLRYGADYRLCKDRLPEHVRKELESAQMSLDVYY